MIKASIKILTTSFSLSGIISMPLNRFKSLLTVSQGINNISYIYSADGAKLAKVGTGGATTWYAGSFVYSGSSLTYIQHPEGMYLPGGNYQYYLKDHLGNIRLIFTPGPSAPILSQRTDYYPFGLSYGQFNSSTGNNYLYNGKELQDELGWKVYDYGARFYDPSLGRWHSVDPIAEKYYSFSPYMYAANNPILYIDPDGRKFLNFDEQGNYTGTTKDNWFHNTFVGSKGRVLNGEGEVTQKFKFADAKSDVAAIESGEISKLVFVQESEIVSMLSKGGAFTSDNKLANMPSETRNDYKADGKLAPGERYAYINKEGKGGGKLDFSYKGIPNQYPGASSDPLNIPSSMIFLVDGVAHNHMNFGNFLFGVAGNALGYSLVELKAGAHYNSLKNSSTNGYKPQLDSRDDQYSIRKGTSYSNSHGYTNMQYRINVGPLQ